MQLLLFVGDVLLPVFSWGPTVVDVAPDTTLER